MSQEVSSDIDTAISWIHTAARVSNRREEVRQALRETIRLASEMHGAPSLDEPLAEDDPTVTILARCLECWDEYERNAREDEWSDAASDPIRATVRGLGRSYKDGTPAYEIWIPLSARERLPVVNDVRIPIRLWIGGREFQAGLRATENNQYFWLCPDMTDDTGKQSLGRILTDAGFTTNDPVELLVVGREIRLRNSAG